MSHEDIPLAGVIGWPVAHSRSPALHGHWLARYGIRGHYIPMPVVQAHLAEALHLLPKLGFKGVNITLPHKEAALKIADVVSDRAAIIGAANTLTFRADGRIHADNTDGYGFLANLRHSAPGWRPESGPAGVLGAGGAARAIVAALIEAGVPEIRIANRSRPRAEALRADFGPRLVVWDWLRIGEMAEDAATLVNTSSLGMTGQPELRVPMDRLPVSAVVTDIVYTPLRTTLLEDAQAHGCPTVDGLGMLLHQAVPGFERWFGRRPEVDEALRAAVLATG